MAALAFNKLIPVYFSIAPLDGKADDVLNSARETGGFLVICGSGLRRRAEENGVTIIYYGSALRRFTI